MGPSEDNALVCATTSFEGHNFVTLHNGDQPWFPITHFADALEYADPKQVTKLLNGARRDELTEGVDYRDATPGEARLLKDRGLLPKNASGVTLLSESGVYALTFQSRQPKAVAFRQWLSREVLPAIRATGRYEAAPSEAGPMVDEDAVRARVLVELHNEGVLDDRGLVKRLDDEQLTALPGAVLGPLVRRLASGEAPAAPAARASTPPARPQGAQTVGAGLVLAPVKPARASDSGRSSQNLAALLVDWAKKNPARIVQGQVSSKARTPNGGWDGRWLEGGAQLAIRASRADAIFLDAGLNAETCRRQMRADGLLIVRESDIKAGYRGMTMALTLGSHDKARCVVFEVRHAG